MTSIINTLTEPFQYLFDHAQRVHWLYILGAVIIAYLIYIVNKPIDEKGENKRLLSFLFPKDIYLHKSSLLDYRYFYVNSILQAIFLIPLFAGTNAAVSSTLKIYLENQLGAEANILPGDNVAITILFTILVAIAMDLGVYIGHYMQHKVPWLWEFHKVHHSATVLNPITVYRMHPIDNILIFSLAGLLMGITNGLYLYLVDGDGNLFNVLGTNALVILYYLLGYNLRHTHIWLSYGPFWSHILISPAMHQIHHSAEQKHYDKNIGLIFSFWDEMFGTLYIPKKEEKFRFGISEDEQDIFDSIGNLYCLPFRNAIKYFNNRQVLNPSKISLLGLWLLIVSTAVFFNESYSIPIRTNSDSVYLEKLTWKEVQDALSNGATTAIIPTGGTEQNGPHMVLGKHNYIIHYTAGQIAERLGNTLVAPVISYVPEGNIESREGHMRFSGTISVSNIAFESVLEDTARSLQAHGFTLICFLGDSGGNQESQRKVAVKLNKEWRNIKTRVLALDNYYFRNGQHKFLTNTGLDNTTIGTHAGIRDTSELMAVFPPGIRDSLLNDYRNTNFSTTGANGNTRLATKEKGNHLIELKIQAAVNQIRAIKNQQRVTAISDS